jgi:hypothetical protein
MLIEVELAHLLGECHATHQIVNPLLDRSTRLFVEGGSRTVRFLANRKD